MQINRVDAFGLDLRYAHGEYVMSDGRRSSSLPSTLVRITTDDGLTGWGEVCPLGTTYLPSHAEGARAALHELGGAILGADPLNLYEINRLMNNALAGHGYAKSPIDIACWDISGKAMGQPVTQLLGGLANPRFMLYEAIPLADPEHMVQQFVTRRDAGIRHFQVKIGDDPRTDASRLRAILEHVEPEDTIVADANCGWRLQDAMLALNLLLDTEPFYLEQPCETLEDCLYVRRHTNLPMVLDEIISDAHSLLRAWHAGGLEAFNLKISKVGGLTNARFMRDLAQRLGLRVTLEDTWGGDVTTAAVSHLAASTSPETLFTVSFMNDWVLDHVAGHNPRSDKGWGQAPTAPGLGIDVDVDLLGDPLFSLQMNS
ncbi:MAG: mandelate racemase [Sphaerobacteraceae bacterium]|nr:MAG: mandelate racemase [Sphaerobacteraceae bacterium]